jgi:hypothetical protein
MPCAHIWENALKRRPKVAGYSSFDKEAPTEPALCVYFFYKQGASLRPEIVRTNYYRPRVSYIP